MTQAELSVIHSLSASPDTMRALSAMAQDEAAELWPKLRSAAQRGDGAECARIEFKIAAMEDLPQIIARHANKYRE